MEANVYYRMTAASTPIQGRCGVCCSGWSAKHTNGRVKTANMDGGAVWFCCGERWCGDGGGRQRPEPPGVCTSGGTWTRGNWLRSQQKYGVGYWRQSDEWRPGGRRRLSMDRHDEEGDVAIECGREPPVRSQVSLGGAESKIGADFKVHLRSNRNILLLWYRRWQSV